MLMKFWKQDHLHNQFHFHSHYRREKKFWTCIVTFLCHFPIFLYHVVEGGEWSTVGSLWCPVCRCRILCIYCLIRDCGLLPFLIWLHWNLRHCFVFCMTCTGKRGNKGGNQPGTHYSIFLTSHSVLIYKTQKKPITLAMERRYLCHIQCKQVRKIKHTAMQGPQTNRK